MAGLLRGVRPIGDWLMSMTLSMLPAPSMRSWAPGRTGRRPTRPASAFSRTSFTSVLFPDPDTPVTQVSAPSGNPASMPRRLCSRAPRTVIQPLPGRREGGTGMARRPDR